MYWKNVVVLIRGASASLNLAGTRNFFNLQIYKHCRHSFSRYSPCFHWVSFLTFQRASLWRQLTFRNRQPMSYYTSRWSTLVTKVYKVTLQSRLGFMTPRQSEVHRGLMLLLPATVNEQYPYNDDCLTCVDGEKVLSLVFITPSIIAIHRQASSCSAAMFLRLFKIVPSILDHLKFLLLVLNDRVSRNRNFALRLARLRLTCMNRHHAVSLLSAHVRFPPVNFLFFFSEIVLQIARFNVFCRLFILELNWFRVPRGASRGTVQAEPGTWVLYFKSKQILHFESGL